VSDSSNTANTVSIFVEQEEMQMEAQQSKGSKWRVEKMTEQKDDIQLWSILTFFGVTKSSTDNITAR